MKTKKNGMKESTARIQWIRFTMILYIAYKYVIYTICGTKIL